MSVIAIQAEAAPYKVPDPPPELAESFAEIRTSALEGLTELRRVLGVLRTGDEPQTAPQPGLERLEEVLASARNGGLTIEVNSTGEASTLPQGVALSAHRILQEALSNAMKHAPGAAVTVDIGYRTDELRLRVVNGPGSAPAAGRRERRRPRPRRHARACDHARWHSLRRPRPGRRFRRRRRPPVPEGRHMIRVLIADDQGMVRSGFTILLNAQPDIHVIGEAVNGEEAVARAAEQRPDVVLMDVRMPVMDGLAATRIITAGEDAPKVLVLTTFDLDDYVYEALRAGASGFLLKDASAGELSDAVRVVAKGDALLAPGVTRRLIAEFARMGAAARPGRTARRGAHRTRGRGARPGRARHVQRRDRRHARRRRADRQDARRAHPHEAGAARPYAGGRVRVRDRAGPPRRIALTGYAA